MERLTIKLDGRNAIRLGRAHGASIEALPDFDNMHLTGDVADRLAAYEDTGFTPEEVATFPYRKEFAYADYMKELFPKMERAEELSAADREGRIIIPPCKLGDAVWVLHTGFNTNFLHVYQGRCIEISLSFLNGSAVENYLVDFFDFKDRLYESDIGLLMFFSEAEADAALKKIREE